MPCRNWVYKNDGGVLIAVKKLLPAVLATCPEPVGVEFVAVMIKTDNISFLFVTVSYTLSSSDTYVYTEHTRLIKLAQLHPKSCGFILMLGDFNLPHVT
uniref:Endonuclease/exonuclease/phosphatase domain-containing protein n=1 Tax=Glossina palpalis gambiensis TaxID=67801 RepID=A0A1B0BHJ2_9MUSC